MADEAVIPAGGERETPRPAAKHGGAEWVRALDAGSEERARWIDDDDAPSARRIEGTPGAGQPLE